MSYRKIIIMLSCRNKYLGCDQYILGKKNLAPIENNRRWALKKGRGGGNALEINKHPPVYSALQSSSLELWSVKENDI